MSHFAKVVQGVVEAVIVAEQDFIDVLPDKELWIQTSYNTYGNVHYGPDGKPDDKPPLRGNFAGIGSIYDAENDVFYPPQPSPDHVLDKSRWIWVLPEMPVTEF